MLCQITVTFSVRLAGSANGGSIPFTLPFTRCSSRIVYEKLLISARTNQRNFARHGDGSPPRFAKIDDMKLRCYCCGEGLDKNFVLVSMSKSDVDRVFVMKTEHVERVKDIECIRVTAHDDHPLDGCVCGYCGAAYPEPHSPTCSA